MLGESALVVKYANVAKPRNDFGFRGGRGFGRGRGRGRGRGWGWGGPYGGMRRGWGYGGDRLRMFTTFLQNAETLCFF